MNDFHWIERLERNSRRSAQIVAVLVKYGLADWLRKIPASRIQEWLRDDHGQPIPDLSPPERIRLALTELGTTFIKLGQMLSTRPDVMGQEMAHELERLQSQTPPDPPRTAQATVRKELGGSDKNLFGHFEPEPFASASIAQVHHARLHSGEKVVVKIQKHGIEEAIEADLSIMVDLAALAEKHSPDLKRYRPVALIRQFAQGLRGELDFTRERRNLETFRNNFAGDGSVYFPHPCAELSSRSVLTMERLEGILISETAKLRAHASDLNFVKRTTQTVAGQQAAFTRMFEAARRLDERIDPRGRQIRLRVSGHTDSDGSPDTNLSLSRARAERIRELLAARNFRRLQLVTEGVGSANPLIPGVSEESNQINRRVSFHAEAGERAK